MPREYDEKRREVKTDTYEYEKLQEAIKSSEVTQTELAAVVGVSQSMISQFLAGKRGLSFFTYTAICKAIRREPKEFLTEEAKKSLTLEL